MAPNLDADLQSVFATPFVASWIGKARPGDVTDPDYARRTAAYAQWALTNLQTFTGHLDRTYVGLVLPGRFYEPGAANLARPHLEIPSGMLKHADESFPERLAAAGNALQFNWWLVPEAKAARRAIFSLPRGELSPLLTRLDRYRPGLVQVVKDHTSKLGDDWLEVESELVTEPARLAPVLCDTFTTDEIAVLLPSLKELRVSAAYDEKLATHSREWVARRLGIWRIRGEDSTDGEFSLGVLTPRLTKSSLFSDPLFTPERESTAALMMRALVLSRLHQHLHNTAIGRVPVRKTVDPHGAYLRSVPAKVGEKMPEASLDAAVAFVQTFPRSEDAWNFLTTWANNRTAEDGPCQAVLTVSEKGFNSAHRAVRRAVVRAEAPLRDDVNILLPLAWDANSKVVRVTFTKPTRSEEASSGSAQK